MKKNVAAVVSGMGLALAILTNLMEAVRRLGGQDEDFHVLSTPGGVGLLDQIAELIVEAGQKARNVCRVLVNYDQPLSEAIKAGKYDGYVNPSITQENFPADRQGEQKVVVEWLHFNRLISTPAAKAEIKKQGYRPANPRELLALGAAQPDLQRQFPIVALGQEWSSPGGYRFVPYLCRGDAGRDLDLDYVEDDWHDNYRFAVVRELVAA